MSLPLLHSPADVVRWLLVRDGYATDPADQAAWPCFSPSEPDRPDNCLTVRSTEGTTSGRLQATGEETDRWGFQLRVRARDEPTGVAKAHALRKALLEVFYQEAVTLDEPAAAYTVHSFVRVGQVMNLGAMRPDSKRWLLTINAQVILERAS